MEYTPENLMQLDEKQLRREYTKYRDIAQKRLKRLENAGFGNSGIVGYFGGDVPKLRDIKDKDSIAFGLAELKGFIDAKQSTVTGMRIYIKEEREKAQKIDRKLGQIIDTLNRHFPMGKKFNEDNIQEFFDFMNNEVSQNIEVQYNSDRLAELFKVAKSKGIKNLRPMLKSEKDLMFFMNNLENIEAVSFPKGKHNSVKGLKALIESEIYHGRDRSEIFKSQYYEDSGERKARTNRRTRTSKRH